MQEQQKLCRNLQKSILGIFEHFADEIHKALKLDIEERRRKQNALYQRVSTNTASFWGKSFVSSLMKNFDREEEESRLSDFHSEQKEEETQ